MRNLTVIFNAQVSADSMGGGDKIVLNIGRKLKDNFGFILEFAGCPEGRGMLEKSYKDIPFVYLNNFSVGNLGFIVAYFFRILAAPSILFSQLKKNSLLWSASDFLPDTLPGFLFRLFNKESRWISSLFLVARNPFHKEVDFTFRTVFYFFSQRISIFLFKIKADGVAVLCDDDKQFLIKLGLPANKVFVTSGGVDINEFEKISATEEKKYDGCFVGRFHYQKGLDDLVYVWKNVVKKYPLARLAIIGWGDPKSVENLKKKIKDYSLENNIHLLGFLDGVEKISIIKSSKILLFPSSFESWGVVVAEGIAAHTPVIAYKLPVLINNFKKGVVWVDPFDKDMFFEKALSLLSSQSLRDQLVDEVKDFMAELDWQKTSEKFYQELVKLKCLE